MTDFSISNMPSILLEKFDEPVLYAPARISNGCNSLKIITGFTDCERISTHMINLCEGIKTKAFCKNLSVDIILGMSKSSLSQKKHEDICRLLRYLQGTRDMPKVTCRYICNGAEVHSKMYVWTNDTEIPETPIKAFCGSLNYTMNAFYKRREIVSECNPYDAYQYYLDLLPDTIDCFDEAVSERIKKVVNNSAVEEEIDTDDEDYNSYDKMTPIDTLDVSLLQADGSKTGYGSGINWGIRPNGTKRNKNQAYIPYNHSNKKEGFFPDRINPEDDNCPMFRVVTKDFGSFHMRMAQQGNKALHSVESNAILGEWIRKRLDVPDGGYVTKEMLEKYGRTYVTFRKYEDGTYLLDF